MARRILGAACALVLALVLAPSAALAQTDSWDGTADTSWYDAAATDFTLTSAEQLAGLAQLVNSGTDLSGKTVTLGVDVTLNDTAPDHTWTPIGYYVDSSDNASFAGTFDGAGHTVVGLYVNGGSANCQGLFGYSSGMVGNVSVTESYVAGRSYIGGVVGTSSGTVSGCSYSGTVSGTGNDVGGVVGYSSGTVSGCSSSATVSSGGFRIGGVVGYNNSGTVANCYATGSVGGTGTYVGGVVGNNSGTVTNCYATGSVSGTSPVGGVVGYNNSGTVANCYATGSVSGTSSVGGVVGGNYGTASHCFFLQDATTNAGLGAVGVDYGTTTGCSAVSGTDASKAALLTELDAWVGTNQTTPASYATWARDTSATSPANGGWPTFSYAVTLHANGGTLSGGLTGYLAGTETTLPTATRAGYTFGGWFGNEALTDSPVTSIPSSATGDREYWCAWSPTSYPIGYVLGDGATNAAANPASYTVTSPDITLADPTRAGYTFDGWYDASGTRVTSIASGSTGDLTLTARWTKVEATPVVESDKKVTPQSGSGAVPSTGDGNGAMPLLAIAIVGAGLAAVGMGHRSEDTRED